MAPLQGTILALAAAGNFLFAGCQDCSIKVWALNAETKGFSPVVSTMLVDDVQPSGVLHVSCDPPADGAAPCNCNAATVPVCMSLSHAGCGAAPARMLRTTSSDLLLQKRSLSACRLT